MFHFDSPFELLNKTEQLKNYADGLPVASAFPPLGGNAL
jgi:hypothetical protein